MTNSNKSKKASKNILNTSWDIWDYLNEQGGLDVKNYDLHIVEEICKRLNIPVSCKDLKTELQKRNISSELFIGAFLKAIQPYAQMMTDLCVFFYLHGIKRTNRKMKILFDFGKGLNDLGFDLKHFREILLKYSKISQYVTIYSLDYKILWQLADVFRSFREYKPRDADIKKWLFNYEAGKFDDPPSILPNIGIKEIDFWLDKVWQVWTTIILEIKKYGSKRDDLRKCAKLSRRENSKKTNEVAGEVYESIRRSQELPDFEEWDTWTLFVLDSDRWPGKVLRYLFGFVNQLEGIPRTERMKKAQSTIRRIQNLFLNVRQWSGEIKVLIKELLELLNLPIWNKRHELYQTWVLTQIDKALENYQRTIHHVNGALILRFSGTHVGTIETEEGRVYLWSELRSPLANPLGKGRKGNIQPDYTLTFEPITAPSKTVMAIECKQYRKANPRNFADALIDYARGYPNAKILLVNYSGISRKVLDRVGNKLKAQTLIVGDFMPSRPEKIETFNRLLLNSLPTATAKTKISEPFQKTQFDLIAIDISSSMAHLFDESTIKNIIQMLIHFSPSAKLLAIDTAIRKEWTEARDGLQELINLSKDGGTYLPEALFDLSLERSVILTDDDGRNQLNNMKIFPYLVIETKDENTLYFHFKD